MKYLYIFVAISFILACQNSSPVLDGNIINAENMNVYFDQFNPVTNTNNMLGKTETNSKGDFKINLPESLEPGVYRLRVGAKSAYLILDGKVRDLEFFSDLEKFDRFDYQVNGSALTQEFQNKINQYVRREIGSEDLIYYTQSEASPLVAYLLANISLKGSSFALIHRSVLDRVKEDYGNSELTSSYEAIVNQYEKEMAQMQSVGRIRLGAPAPDIELPNPDGKSQRLSDLKGKVVLLDFWASWCGPCRKANPHVVETYNKYKDKGFTVFSVSLDGLDDRTKRRFPQDQLDFQLQRSKERWVQAILQDNLEWKNHVSDLKKWDSIAAAEYGVSAIPRTYLIDREGKIAAINPRYDLEQQLLKLL